MHTLAFMQQIDERLMKADQTTFAYPDLILSLPTSPKTQNKQAPPTCIKVTVSGQILPG